jgi:hypothetical protein
MLAVRFEAENMDPHGAEVMARPKAQPKGRKAAAPVQTQRVTIINLKGSAEQADWLEKRHRQTHLAKSVIVRLALALWGEQNDHPPFPLSDSEDDE